MGLRHWVWLSSLTNASPKARAALCAHYGDAEEAFHAPPGDYKNVPGVTERDAAILENRDLRAADEILGRCEMENLEPVALTDSRYPKRLRNIFAPPVVLYVKGRLPDVDAIPSVAVIGTRSATPYGIKMGREIAFEIARCGGVVLSGLTEGIDRAAARGCLLAGGRLIGVLGTGHGADNDFTRDICMVGALVSEYPPGTPVLRHFFRERNRITAGLSHAVCVVEAPEKSGSLLFAREALEQGREIFAVPGNADAVNSAGTLALIKQGARPAACGWDVLEDFAELYPKRISRPGRFAVPPDPKPEELACTPPEPEAEEKKEIDKEKASGYSDWKEQLAKLSEEQLQIVTAIGRGEAHIDDIIEETGLSAAKVLAQLTVLEIKGYIHRAAGRRVALNLKSK